MQHQQQKLVVDYHNIAMYLLVAMSYLIRVHLSLESEVETNLHSWTYFRVSSRQLS